MTNYELEALLGKTLSELQEVALSAGLQKFAGKQLAEWLYVRRVRSFDEMTNISLKGREALKAQYIIGRHAPVREAVSADGTRKYLFEVPNHPSPFSPSERGAGGVYIESVYIPEEDRATLCVSTQTGCKMGCRFCMTGTLGFHGNLPASEILNQIFEIDAMAAGNRLSPLSNLVYMGEGEPMDNPDEVLRSLEIMTAAYGCAWSPRRITVSTVGIPAMKRFLDESECHLAVSMHNPFAAEREQIMPAQKAMSITEVVTLLKRYDWSRQRRVSFEYICWAGQNDTPRHAKELLRLLKGLPCRINLIRFHEGVEEVATTALESRRFPASDEHRMEWLRDYLTANGITTTIRRSRGEDILAACGMLVNSLTR
ncbi:MAG: 23S rRNA (adenine(2503)-C(2))-methyltransferase RlmN [Paludibacteraceae bacterium]|nr:23S rRNA (adenine(2503)-C(2))-methyltransferase RlmN [Paludibacteraceae bacterium]